MTNFLMKCFFLSIAVCVISGTSALSEAGTIDRDNVCKTVSQHIAEGVITLPLCPGLSASELNTSGADELRDIIILKCAGAKKFSLVPAQLINSPSIEVRKAAYDIQLFQARRFIVTTRGDKIVGDETAAETRSSILAYLKYAESSFSNADILEAKNQVNGFIDDFSSRRNKGTSKASLICMTYNVPGCADALKRVISVMDPQVLRGGHSAVSMVPLFRKVVSDPAYVRGTIQAALKVIDRIETAEKSGSPAGDFFSDMESAFIEAGNPPERAREMSWDLIAIYASRGASVDVLKPLMTKKNAVFLASLYVISAGISYLDSFTTGEAYSLPPTVSSKCVTGKPYHFWLSSFLSRKLVQEGHGEAAAKIAVHLAAVGYQFTEVTALGRDPSKPFTDKEVYSVNSNAIRVSLAHNAAGTVYGAESLNAYFRPLSVDHALNALLDQARSLPRRNRFSKIFPESYIGLYQRWKELIAPDAALYAFGNP